MTTPSVSADTFVRFALLALALIASALGTASAFAQAAAVHEPERESVHTPAVGSALESAREPNDALYQDLGGNAGLTALVDDFVNRLLADARTNPFFRDADQKKLRSRLVEQLCDFTGGPCRFSGKNMRTAHAGQDITRTNFNAVVEILQDSLDARDVPFAVQNHLLAHLAPLHRDIVNVH